MAEVFPTVLRDPIEDTNTLLIGSEAPGSAQKLAAAVPALPEDLRVIAARESGNVEERLPGGEVSPAFAARMQDLLSARRS